MSIVTFDVKFINPGTTIGLQASPVTVDIFNSENVLQASLVLPTGIDEIDDDPGVGTDFRYEVALFDATDQADFPGNFISVVWNGEIGGQPYATIGANVAIQPGFVEPTDFEPFEPPYSTLAEANFYWNFKLDGDDWNEFTDNQKFLALFSASEHIDQLNYWGRKFFLTGTVGRQFPRILPADLFEFTAIEEVDIPLKVKTATQIQALYLLRNKRDRTDPAQRQDLQNQGVTGVSRLSSSESWDLDRRRRHMLTAEAYNEIKSFIFRGGTALAGGTGY